MADTSTPPPPLPEEARGAAPGRNRLRGRRVVVVGAGTRPNADPDKPIGNGQAIARLAAREGAAVACIDVDADAADETAAHIRAAGGTAAVIVADVAAADACARLVRDAVAALGGVDDVVCNVGIGAGMGLAGTTAETWDLVMAVNLRAHFLVARAAMELDTLRSLVFVGSVAGLRPGSRLPAYDASKAGLLGLVRHVAFEGAPRGIRANAVVPGLIDTPLGRLATAGRPGRARTPVPLGRQGTGWEVAYATIFLMSDESSYVTAQALVVDGGLSIVG